MTRNKIGILVSALVFSASLAPMGVAAVDGTQAQPGTGTPGAAPLIGRIVVTPTRAQMEKAVLERRIASNDRKAAESRRTAAMTSNATDAL